MDKKDECEKNTDMIKKVSVIITTYKRNISIVERAVRSVANQKYENIELLVINDNPDDIDLSNKINDLLKKYCQLSSKYIVVEKNGGACRARNLGIKNSTGYYIAFLDDDDEWLDNKIEEQVREFESNSNLGIVYCNSIMHDDDKNIEKIRFNNIQPSGYIYDRILSENIIGSCSFPMFTKNVLNEFQGFREDMPAMQDWELYIRISKKYECYYIDKPLVIYHKYNGERISKNYGRRVIAHRKIEEEFGDEIKQNKNALYSFYISDCNLYSANGQKIIALKHLMKAINLKPFRVKNNLKTLTKYIITFFVKGNKL